MELNTERLERILDSSDETLLPRLERIFNLVGVEEAKREKLLSDLPALREKACALTQTDIERVKRVLGEEFLQSLARILEGECD